MCHRIEMLGIQGSDDYVQDPSAGGLMQKVQPGDPGGAVDAGEGTRDFQPICILLN